MPGHHVHGREIYGAVSHVIGRRRFAVPMPGPVATTSTRAIDAVQSRLPARWRYPADREGAEICLRDTRLDAGPAERDLGVKARSFESSIRDTVEWMVDAEHVKEKYRPR